MTPAPPVDRYSESLMVTLLRAGIRLPFSKDARRARPVAAIRRRIVRYERRLMDARLRDLRRDNARLEAGSGMFDGISKRRPEQPLPVLW